MITYVCSQLAPLLGKVSQRSPLLLLTVLLSTLRGKVKIPPLCTLLFYQIESLKNGASSFAFQSF